MMNIDLSGKNAVVTGSTRGIGRAIAEAFARSGARVAVVGRDQQRADEAAAAIGGNAKGFAADVSDTASVSKLVDEVEKAFGSIDILVNNAGITRDNLVMRLKDEDWDAVQNANLRGAFAAIRAVSRGMMKKRAGRIINVASTMRSRGTTRMILMMMERGLMGLDLSRRQRRLMLGPRKGERRWRSIGIGRQERRGR